MSKVSKINPKCSGDVVVLAKQFPNTVSSGKGGKENLSLQSEEILDIQYVKSNSFEYTLSDLDFAFLAGNCVNGKMTFPISGYLVLAWCAFAKLNGKTQSETPIIFENVHCKNIVFDNSGLKLQVTILLGSGKFEIYESGVVVSTGTIRLIDDPTKERISNKLDKSSGKNLLPLSSEDIYKELAFRGYCYSGAFRGIQSCDQLTNTGIVFWNNNWISFIDTMLQFDNLRTTYRDLYLPSRLDQVLIDPKAHLTSILSNKNEIPIWVYADINMIVAGGIEIKGIKWNIEPRNTKLLAKYEQRVILPDNNDEFCQKLNNSFQEVEQAYVTASATGELSKLRWVMSSPHKSKASPSELCQVHYTGLNHQDLEIAKAKQINSDRRLGVEFSGVTTSGKRIMGIVKSGALATEVVIEKPFVWEIPTNWRINAAASVPVAFVTAYFALVVKGQMKPNQTVVVYSGASVLGQAAITLALRSGCRVFTTIRTRDQKEYIRRYLEVPLQDVGLDSDPNFEKMVLERTNYHGVHLVVNFLGEAKIPNGMRCLCTGGRFLQVRKSDSDIFSQNLDLSMFGKNKSFQIVQIDSMSEAEKNTVAEYVTEGISNGQVYPVMHTESYLPDQLQDAFNFLSKSDELFSKIMVGILIEEESGQNKVRKIRAIPQTYMHPDKTYILIDGVHGFGLELAQWLVTRGATKVVLSSRHGVQTGYQTFCIRRLREKGVKVIVTTIDSTTIEGAKNLFLEANTLGPVGGLFDLTALHQITNANNAQEITRLLKGIKSIDAASREHDVNQLDHFALFAPVEGGKDAKDSIVSKITNIVKSRKKNGHPGMVLCLDGIDRLVNAGKLLADKLDSFKCEPQLIESITEALDSLLIQPFSAVEVKLFFFFYN